jgi:hypothetical protein
MADSTEGSHQRGSLVVQIIVAVVGAAAVVIAAVISHGEPGGRTSESAPPSPVVSGSRSPSPSGPLISIAPSHASVVLGALIEILGVVRDGRDPGCAVQLQRLSDGRWLLRPPAKSYVLNGRTYNPSAVGHYSVDAAGRYSVIAFPPGTGTVYYRVVAPACSGHPTLTSSSMEIDVNR